MGTTVRLGRPGRTGILSRARHDRKGGVAITVALMLPVLVAASGLVFDAGYYRWRERVLQSASDAAAMAAGQDASSGLVTATQMFYAANEEAVRNGFMDGNFGWNGGVGVVTSTPQGSIQVNSPPAQSPAYKGQAGYVEVILTENRPRMFSALWQGPGTQPDRQRLGRVDVGQRRPRHAANPTGSGCLLALDPTSKGTFTTRQFGTASGTNKLNVVSAGCETVVNSNANQAIYTDFNSNYSNSINEDYYPGLLTINPNTNPGRVFGTVVGDGSSFGGWGTYQTPAGAPSNPSYMTCNIWSPCSTGATTAANITTGNADPYSGTILPNGPLASSGAGSCIDSTGPGATVSGGVLNLPAGRYCKGFNFTGGIVNLSPGITVVESQFNASNTTINGLNGSTLILGNGYPLSFTNSRLNIKAPTSGITAGIAMTEYADSPNTAYSAMMPDPSVANPNFNWKIPNSAFPTAPGTVDFASGNLTFTGSIYMPRRLVYFENAMRVTSFGGTAGCGHVIAGDLGTEYDLVLGNNCAGTGVLPFGSLATSWATTICQTPAGALDANCGTSSSGQASSGASVKIVQ